MAKTTSLPRKENAKYFSKPADSKGMQRYFPYLLLALGALYFFSSGSGDFALEPGVLIPDEPNQYAIQDHQKWKQDDYVFTPLANFEMEGRVVLSKRYWFGDESDLSPVDLVLAWGPLSDTNVLQKISFRQGGRFYHWRTKEPPVALRTISQHTANMHMIPADDKVRERLLSLERDDLITLTGKLVRIDRADGWSWKSSLTRNDTGAGACEVIWVESVARISSSLNYTRRHWKCPAGVSSVACLASEILA